MAPSGENGGELSLALELSPLASLSTALDMPIQYFKSQL